MRSTMKMRVAAAAVLAGALLSGAGAGQAQSHHVTASGAPCITPLGETYDRGSDWYSYGFQNACGLTLYIEWTSSDGVTHSDGIMRTSTRSIVTRHLHLVDWHETM
jgi:hypothetical protein